MIRKDGIPIAPLPEESRDEEEDIGFRCLFGSTSVDPGKPRLKDLSKGESLLTPMPLADQSDVPEASPDVPKTSPDVPVTSAVVRDVPEASPDSHDVPEAIHFSYSKFV